MQGTIAPKGAGIFLRLQVEKSTFEPSLAYIAIRFSLNQLRLLAVSLYIRVHSASVLKTCQIHLPFKACLFHIWAKQFGYSVTCPVKNILCIHGCLKSATCEHTKIGGIGPREIKGRKTKRMMSFMSNFQERNISS